MPQITLSNQSTINTEEVATAEFREEGAPSRRAYRPVGDPVVGGPLDKYAQNELLVEMKVGPGQTIVGDKSEADAQALDAAGVMVFWKHKPK